uniref:Aminopeptidase n=1 Tax=Caenorhabditis tropicalis TaxID=1561998 RepID=A0A1I7TFV7_9PELO
MSATFKSMIPVCEGEPCIRNGSNGGPTVHFRQESRRRKSDFARKCIAVILLHAIFLFAILAALIIGHWISEENQKMNNRTMLNLTLAEAYLLESSFFTSTSTPDDSLNHHHTRLLTTSSALGPLKRKYHQEWWRG